MKHFKSINTQNLIKEPYPFIFENAPEDLVNFFSYQEGMSFAYDLYFRDIRDDDAQDFAIRVFFALREKYSKNGMGTGKMTLIWAYCVA